MIKTSDVVKDTIYSSEIALAALGEGYLNLSAYAKSIRGEVEEEAKKEVSIGSIIVALSRLRRSLEKSKPLIPRVSAQDISVKSGLIEIAFDRTKDSLKKLRLLYGDEKLNATDFFVVTQGVGEVMIIALEVVQSEVVRIYKPQKPKALIPNLVSITVRFKEEYIATPNIIYALLRNLALKRINIVEIVSTYTELTFIVSRESLEEAFSILHGIFKHSPQTKRRHEN